MWIGVTHFSSVFFACLYQKYLSENIEQLLEVFFGIDEQLSKNKKIVSFYPDNCSIMELKKDKGELELISLGDELQTHVN